MPRSTRHCRDEGGDPRVFKKPAHRYLWARRRVGLARRGCEIKVVPPRHAGFGFRRRPSAAHVRGDVEPRRRRLRHFEQRPFESRGAGGRNRRFVWGCRGCADEAEYAACRRRLDCHPDHDPGGQKHGRPGARLAAPRPLRCRQHRHRNSDARERSDATDERPPDPGIANPHRPETGRKARAMPQHSETSRAQAWLEKFGAALEESRIGDAAAMFGQECYWRDLISFTWNIKTLEGRGEIEAMLAATLPSTRPCRWRIEGEAWVAHGMIEAWFAFETSIARGKGHLRLKGDQCWTLLTTMAELKGHEEKKSARRIKGVDHGLAKGRKTWLERRREEESSLGEGEQPFCLIIGGGQGGIALGARLRRLGVPTIIVEKRAKAGDSWRARYKSLVLHDPVWYDHLPYLPFPDDWPIFTPKDKVGDWLEMYAKVMELNYWGSAECTGAQYSEVEKEWAVSIV